MVWQTSAKSVWLNTRGKDTRSVLSTTESTIESTIRHTIDETSRRLTMNEWGIYNTFNESIN